MDSADGGIAEDIVDVEVVMVVVDDCVRECDADDDGDTAVDDEAVRGDIGPGEVGVNSCD